jgi:hypothetical protein
MNLRDIGVIERGEHFRLALEAGEALAAEASESGSTLIATLRFRFVSLTGTLHPYRRHR